MENRGKIALRYYADINIFDLEQIKDKATYLNSQEYSEGFQYVLVSGQFSLAHGSTTDVAAGRPIIHNQALLEKELSTEEMLTKLKSAFGGSNVLYEIQTFIANIEINNPDDKPKKSQSFFDFDNTRIAQAVPAHRMLENMKLNFLYFLRSRDVKLLGLSDIPEHNELS